MTAGAGGLVAIVAAVVGLLLFALVVVVGLLGVYLLFFRKRAPAGPTREEALRDLGYTPGPGPKTWSRSFEGTTMVFSEAQGWKWTIRLPRYNTLTVHVEERDGGATPEGREFETEKPILDRRFAFAAGSPGPQTVALMVTPAVMNAMLSLKYVSLQLSGDELVLTDPQRRNLGDAAADGPDAVEAERAAHLAVIALVTSMFNTMFSKFTGTIMPEFR
jgi:hypothetical protein